MTINQKALVFVAVIVLGGLIWGAYQFPQVQQLVGSPAGTTFSSAKIASQVVQVSTTTVFSALNSDASDRVINSAEVFLTGGTSTSTAYTITCATSTSASAIISNTNNILKYTIAAVSDPLGSTTAASFNLASTSPGIMGTTTPQGGAQPQSVNSWARIWKTGTYLTCTQTSAGGSVSGLFDSNVTGTITFPYRGQ